MKRVVAFFACLSLVLFAACNNKSDDGKSDGTVEKERQISTTEAKDKSAPPVATKAWDSSKGTSTITGTVKYTGKPPKRRPIDMGGKPECAAHQSEPALDESIIVSADGNVKNAFVYVRSGVEEWKFPIPTEIVALSQKGCTFSPHVIGAQVGQKVKFVNGDTCPHNVRSTPGSRDNASFNFTQAPGSKEDIKTFDAQDVFVRIGCDLHGWMRANIGVVDNPFFAITGDDGKFELKNLPKGKLTIEVVHEEFGRKTETVKLGDKETKELKFEFAKQ